MGGRNRIECRNLDCRAKWCPETDTPAKGFVPHIDPITGRRKIYSKCPECGTHWHADLRDDAPEEDRRHGRGRGVDMDRRGRVTDR